MIRSDKNSTVLPLFKNRLFYLDKVSKGDLQVLELVLVVVALVGVRLPGVGVAVLDGELHQGGHRLEAVSVFGRRGQHEVRHSGLLVGQAFARDAGHLIQNVKCIFSLEISQ